MIVLFSLTIAESQALQDRIREWLRGDAFPDGTPRPSKDIYADADPLFDVNHQVLLRCFKEVGGKVRPEHNTPNRYGFTAWIWVPPARESGV